jgi:hypothetical protein
MFILGARSTVIGSLHFKQKQEVMAVRQLAANPGGDAQGYPGYSQDGIALFGVIIAPEKTQCPRISTPGDTNKSTTIL